MEVNGSDFTNFKEFGSVCGLTSLMKMSKKFPAMSNNTMQQIGCRVKRQICNVQILSQLHTN